MTAVRESAPPVPDAGSPLATPEAVPRPTYFPASMAFGITMLLAGIITSPVVLAMGALAVGVSLAGWIGEMRRDP
jgi:hypothetical protein